MEQSPVASQHSAHEELPSSCAGALLIPYEDQETCAFILSEAIEWRVV